MTPTDWANIIMAITNTIVAIVAVSSLLFVWKELKNIERNQRAASAQNITTGERELWLSVLSDKDMTILLSRHLGMSQDLLEKAEMSEGNALRILMFFRQYENIYYQHINKMMPPDLWQHWRESMEYTFKDERARILFDKVHVGYSQSFKDFIKQELVPNILKAEGVFHSQKQ